MAGPDDAISDSSAFFSANFFLRKRNKAEAVS
jgi:hypothetical protein